MPKANEITVTYDETRLRAIEKFSSGDVLPIDTVLAVALDDIYMKRVPPEVRAFIDDTELPLRRKRNPVKKTDPTPANEAQRPYNI